MQIERERDTYIYIYTSMYMDSRRKASLRGLHLGRTHINMEACIAPFLEDSRLIRSPSPLPCSVAAEKSWGRCRCRVLSSRLGVKRLPGKPIAFLLLVGSPYKMVGSSYKLVAP